jgi:outer membrane protein OmpA-like peptidoglycan-associated protein
MGERALTASWEETNDVARRVAGGDGESHGDSPAIRLLDALRAGDDVGILAVCGEVTTVSAENMNWSCRGRDEIHRMLTQTRERFPGLTFESRTRHIGFGLVIDEARVQDDLFEEGDTEPEATTTPAVPERPVPDPGIHPMWDEPVTEQRNVMSVWREKAQETQPAIRLNMPVRVAVRHDDLQVHDVTLSFPAALLKRAMGLHVDPLEMSLSEVQSAFIAPVGAGFTTYELARPELTLAPPAPPEPEPAALNEGEPLRRRGHLLVPLLLALLLLVAGGAWYVVQGAPSDNQAAPSTTTPTPTPSHTASPSASPSATATSSEAPTVTEGNPTSGPTRKPNVTLKSGLAFAFNSSSLSPQAKKTIDKVAQEVRAAHLTGKIYVDGYTDNLGSAAYGQVLSQRRATAVSNYLGSRLIGVDVDIVSTGHGEADPIASNATRDGRIANRRVTITLPKP